jgi:hypothetical protein
MFENNLLTGSIGKTIPVHNRTTTLAIAGYEYRMYKFRLMQDEGLYCEQI